MSSDELLEQNIEHEKMMRLMPYKPHINYVILGASLMMASRIIGYGLLRIAEAIEKGK